MQSTFLEGQQNEVITTISFKKTKTKRGKIKTISGSVIIMGARSCDYTGIKVCAVITGYSNGIPN